MVQQLPCTVYLALRFCLHTGTLVIAAKLLDVTTGFVCSLVPFSFNGRHRGAGRVSVCWERSTCFSYCAVSVRFLLTIFKDITGNGSQARVMSDEHVIASSSVIEDSGLLGCDAALLVRWLRPFRRNASSLTFEDEGDVLLRNSGYHPPSIASSLPRRPEPQNTFTAWASFISQGSRREVTSDSCHIK